MSTTHSHETSTTTNNLDKKLRIYPATRTCFLTTYQTRRDVNVAKLRCAPNPTTWWSSDLHHPMSSFNCTEQLQFKNTKDRSRIPNRPEVTLAFNIRRIKREGAELNNTVVHPEETWTKARLSHPYDHIG
jgi:hypothetical protein